MIYCEKCGQQIDEVEICPKCGCYTGYTDSKTYAEQDSNSPDNEYDGSSGDKIILDKASAGWCILSFIVPALGIVLYFLHRSKTPKAAKTYLIIGIVILAISLLSDVIHVLPYLIH